MASFLVFGTFRRHARPCAGHPRFLDEQMQDVDGRDKPGHDELMMRMAMPVVVPMIMIMRVAFDIAAAR